MLMREPDISVKTYVLAYVALIMLMLINIGIGCINLGWANMFISVIVATIQVGVLVMILMQAYLEKPLIHIVMGGALLWFLILVTLTFTDYITRNWLPVAGK
jgi:cytochrome c oxidase subunit 4